MNFYFTFICSIAIVAFCKPSFGALQDSSTCEALLEVTEETVTYKDINLPEVYYRLASQKSFVSQYDSGFRDGSLKRWFSGGGLCGPVCVDNISSTLFSATGQTNAFETSYYASFRIKEIINFINMYEGGNANVGTTLKQLTSALARRVPSQQNTKVKLEYLKPQSDSWSQDQNALYLVIARHPSNSIAHALVLTGVSKKPGDWRGYFSDPQNPNQIVWASIYFDQNYGHYYTKAYGYIIGVLKISMQEVVDSK